MTRSSARSPSCKTIESFVRASGMADERLRRHTRAQVQVDRADARLRAGRWQEAIAAADEAIDIIGERNSGVKGHSLFCKARAMLGLGELAAPGDRGRGGRSEADCLGVAVPGSQGVVASGAA